MFDVFHPQVLMKPAKRLMCWPHISKNVEKHLVTFKKDSKNDENSKKVNSDVAQFQWAKGSLAGGPGRSFLTSYFTS